VTSTQAQTPAPGEQQLAILFRDARVPIRERRGFDWASVVTSAASPHELIVRASRHDRTSRARLRSGRGPTEVSIRDLSYGPEWLSIEVEDGESVHQYLYARGPRGTLTQLLDVVMRDAVTARTTLSWRAANRTLVVLSQHRSFPLNGGQLEPPPEQVVYRWRPPHLVEISRGPVGE